MLSKVVGIVLSLQGRAKTLADMAVSAEFYFREKQTTQKAAKLLVPGIAPTLKEMAEMLSGLAPFDRPSIERSLNVFTERGSGGLKIHQPIRVALTGSTESPDLFTVMELLGREEVVRRLSKAAFESALGSIATVYDAWGDFPLPIPEASGGRPSSESGYRSYEKVDDLHRSVGKVWEEALTKLEGYQILDQIPVLDYGGSGTSRQTTPIRALYLLRDGRVVLGKSLHVQASSRAREMLRDSGDGRFSFPEEIFLKRLREGDSSDWLEPVRENYTDEKDFLRASDRHRQAQNGNIGEKEISEEITSLSHIVREKSNENAFIIHSGAIRIAMAGTDELNLFIAYRPSADQFKTIFRFSLDLNQARAIPVTFDYLPAKRGEVPEGTHCFTGILLPRLIPRALKRAVAGKVDRLPGD